MGHDWDVFLRMGEAARVANLPEVLYLYRMHRGNSDLSRFMEVRIGVDYACHCAAARRAGRPEPSHEEFRRRQQARSWLMRLPELIDAYAMSQYRTALVEMTERRLIKGYGRLIWSAACSPARTGARLRRMLRQWRLIAGCLKLAIPRGRAV